MPHSTNLDVSTLPLRFRLSVATVTCTTGVAAVVAMISSRVSEPSIATAVWLAVSAILAVTLLVDQAARVLVYRRLASIRETMQRAATGQLNARASVDGLDEIGVIARGLNDILEGLERLHEAVDIRVAAANEVFRQRSVEMVDKNREMAILREELARAGRLAALGQAAANMAHQIGTPLNLISGYVQLLLQLCPTESPFCERLKAIQDQIAKVTAVVRAALDSSRPQPVPHERVNLAELVRRVCTIAGPMLEDAHVEVETIAAADPLEVIADPVQLELALLNLISNSVDAMASGGKLTIHVEQHGDRIHFAVADTGSGIPPELVAHIFDPWVTTKVPGKGTGLGLSIARQVVASHGGKITVDNHPGHGAAFIVDLPAAPEVARRADASHAKNSDR